MPIPARHPELSRVHDTKNRLTQAKNLGRCIQWFFGAGSITKKKDLRYFASLMATQRHGIFFDLYRLIDLVFIEPLTQSESFLFMLPPSQYPSDFPYPIWPILCLKR